MLDKKNHLKQLTTIQFIPSQSGHLFCSAENSIGHATANGSVMITDNDKPFTISGFKNTEPQTDPTIGDSVTFECAAFVYNYSKKIIWTKDGVKTDSIHGIKTKIFTKRFSHRSSISWEKISKKFDGIYRCDVFERDSEKPAGSKSFSLKVHDPEAPTISFNFIQTTVKKSINDLFILICNASGRPAPKLLWYKDNKIFKIKGMDNTTRQNILISQDKSNITFKYLKVEYSGRYKCEAENQSGSRSKEFDLIVEGIIY